MHDPADEVPKSSLEITDQQSAQVATHPRVTLNDIQNAIRSRYYMTADGAVLPNDGEDAETLGVLTICFLVMKNGFTVIGKAAPASPENFNRDLGRKFAYEDAVRQLWPIMGYELRQRLYVEALKKKELDDEIPF